MSVDEAIKENWLDRLDKRLAELSNGTKIDSRALYRAVVEKIPTSSAKTLEEVNNSVFALEMARRVALNEVQAEFDGRSTVLYSLPEPI